MRCHSVVVGNELKSKHTPPDRKSSTRSGQKIDAGVPVEMVQEVRQQDDIIAVAPVDIERATANRPIALRDAGGRGIFLGDREDPRPVDRGNFKARNGLRR